MDDTNWAEKYALPRHKIPLPEEGTVEEHIAQVWRLSLLVVLGYVASYGLKPPIYYIEDQLRQYGKGGKALRTYILFNYCHKPDKGVWELSVEGQEVFDFLTKSNTKPTKLEEEL